MFKNTVRDIEVYVSSHSPCEFMDDLYIAEIYRPEPVFLLLTG